MPALRDPGDPAPVRARPSRGLCAAAVLALTGCAAQPDYLLYYPPRSNGYSPYGYSPPPPFNGYGAPYDAPGSPQPSYGYSPPPTPAPGSWIPAQAAAAVAFARARLNTPYCWGGSGPACYDCSGLTWAAWQAAGKSIPRTSEAQLARLTPVPMNQLLPGDILWRPGHVGLYVGEGWAIHAPQTGDVVRYQEASRYQRAVRP